MKPLAQNTIFTVDNTVYCLWGWDLARDNRQALAQIKPGYFEFQAELLAPHLTSEETQQMAALALRLAYHHGLETLFTLLGVLAQAPHAPAAWMIRCQSGDLRRVVAKIDREQEILNSYGRGALSWKFLSSLANCFGDMEPSRQGELQEHFAKLWARFATDFLSQDHKDEYNALKHGFRASPGGFSLSLGLEPVPGVAPPRNEMRNVGSSSFGSSIYRLVSVRDGKKKGDPHVRLVRSSQNWLAESTASALYLLSVSINNIVSGLRVRNGEAPDSVRVRWPPEDRLFDEPWCTVPGVVSLSLKENLGEENIDPVPRSSLKQVLRDRAEKASEPD